MDLMFGTIIGKMVEPHDCTECKESLYGNKYILKEEEPFCIKCYDVLYSNTCVECEKLIECTSKVNVLAGRSIGIV